MSFGMADAFGLTGYPLGHSFSKDFFGKLFAEDGSGRTYSNFPIEKLDKATFDALLAANPELVGLNVTAPHKVAVMAFLDELDPLAEAVGAVNTVKIFRDREGNVLRTKGFNTDVLGFEEAVRPLLRACHTHALVLGTGGASKAAVVACRRLGILPTTVSRTAGKGQLTYHELTPEVMGANLLIVNATPLGTFPNTHSCAPIPYELLGPDHLCFDMVYNPHETLFMRKSAERGAAVANGLEMLHGQAVTALTIWETAT